MSIRILQIGVLKLPFRAFASRWNIPIPGSSQRNIIVENRLKRRVGAGYYGLTRKVKGSQEVSKVLGQESDSRL